MIRLGDTTTGKNHDVKYLWLVKNMDVYRKYSKKECYQVMAFNGNGWWTMYGGTLKDCRKFIGDEKTVNI